jgi:hypothetical protein
MLKQPSAEYRGFRRAGIRLSEELLPELGRLAAGRTRPMLEALHAFAAWSRGPHLPVRPSTTLRRFA